MALTSPRRAGGLYEPLADINVTPLVDVMLVLLIVFMITAPLLAAGMRVDLPQAKAAQPLDPKEPVIVTVARDGTVHLGQDEVAPDDLPAAIKARFGAGSSAGADQSRVIHVRGDREVPYGVIVGVMDRLAQNGLARIALVANARAEAPRRASEPASP